MTTRAMVAKGDVWSGFDAGTLTFGFLWLAVGVVIGAAKTHLYRQKPAVVENL